ncbi:MAG: hypothetical protein ABIE36_02125 [Candidatus Diapherotrites archaeon]
MRKSLAFKIAPLVFAGLGLIGGRCGSSKVFTSELDEFAWAGGKDVDSSKFFGFKKTLAGCAISMNIDSSEVSYYFPKDIDKKVDKFIKRKSFNFLISGDIFEEKFDRTLITYDVKPYLTRDPLFYQLERVRIDYMNYSSSDTLVFNKAKERMKFLMNKYYSLKDSIASKFFK